MVATVELNEALLPAIEVTSGASPVDLPLQPNRVRITSGGTGGDEVINITLPELDDNGENLDAVGQRIVLMLEVQTDGSDSVRITVDGSDGGDFYTATPLPYINRQSTTILNYPGAMVCFVWVGDAYKIDWQLTDWNFDGDREPQVLLLQGAPASEDKVSGLPRAVQIEGGTDNSGTVNGADVKIQPGEGLAHGNIFIDVKPNPSVPTGRMFVLNLPTADPHFPGVAWNNSGVLTISAG